MVSSAEMTGLNDALTIPAKLPLIINSFQPATQLGDLSNPAEYLDNSLGVLARTLKWASSSQCSRVIYSSSAVVYGENANCREQDPVQVHGLHSSLKIAAEQLVSSYAQRSGIDFTIVRPFNLFGGTDRFSVIQRIAFAANSQTKFTLINNGNGLRDYTHVHDAATTYLELAFGENPGILNIGRGQGISVSDLIKVVHQAGIELEIEPVSRTEVNVCVANTQKLSTFVNVNNFIDPVTHLLSQVEK